MNLENSGELLLFINKEKLNYNNVNNYKIYTYFCKCFLKTIIEIHEKLHTTFDKNSIFIGSNVMFNVFWILLLLLFVENYGCLTGVVAQKSGTIGTGSHSMMVILALGLWGGTY